jgi:hypothetical protein
MVDPGMGERLHLYQGTSAQFIADATQARLANHLAERFFEEFPPPASGVRGQLPGQFARRKGPRPPNRRP